MCVRYLAVDTALTAILSLQVLARMAVTPFDAHCCHMGPVPDLVKPSFLIFDIQAL